MADKSLFEKWKSAPRVSEFELPARKGRMRNVNLGKSRVAEWALQDAKAHLSEVIRAAKKKPQRITVRGERTAVLLSEDEYNRLAGRGTKPMTLVEALKACPYPLEIPPRNKERGREIKL